MKINKNKIKKRLKNATSNATANQYISHLRKYWKWLEKNGIEENEEKPEDLIMRYSETLEDRYSKSTINVAQSALITYFQKVRIKNVDTNLITRNIGKETDYEPLILSRDEVDDFFEEISRRWSRQKETMAHVAWEGALRSGELVTIRDDYWEDKRLVVPVLKTWDERRGEYKEKPVPISRKTKDRVDEFIGKFDTEFTFWKENDRRRWLPGEWSGEVKEVTKDLFDLSGHRSHVAHNIFRNTRLTHLAEDTENFLTVLQISGHKEPRVALKYFEQAEVEVPEMEAMERKRWF